LIEELADVDHFMFRFQVVKLNGRISDVAIDLIWLYRRNNMEERETKSEKKEKVSFLKLTLIIIGIILSIAISIIISLKFPAIRSALMPQ